MARTIKMDTKIDTSFAPQSMLIAMGAQKELRALLGLVEKSFGISPKDIKETSNVKFALGSTAYDTMMGILKVAAIGAGLVGVGLATREAQHAYDYYQGEDKKEGENLVDYSLRKFGEDKQKVSKALADGTDMTSQKIAEKVPQYLSGPAKNRIGIAVIGEFNYSKKIEAKLDEIADSLLKLKQYDKDAKIKIWAGRS